LTVLTLKSLCSVGEEADVAHDARLAVDHAIDAGLVGNLAGGRIDGMLEAVAQLGKLFPRLLLVTAVIDVAHRTVLALKLKNHPIFHDNRHLFSTKSYEFQLVSGTNHFIALYVQLALRVFPIDIFSRFSIRYFGIFLSCCVSKLNQ